MDDVVSPADILPGAGVRDGDKGALVTRRRALTFQELDAESDRVAAGLATRGVLPGQPVSLSAHNGWERVTAHHGAVKAGAEFVAELPKTSTGKLAPKTDQPHGTGSDSRLGDVKCLYLQRDRPAPSRRSLSCKTVVDTLASKCTLT